MDIGFAETVGMDCRTWNFDKWVVGSGVDNSDCHLSGASEEVTVSDLDGLGSMG